MAAHEDLCTMAVLLGIDKGSKLEETLARLADYAEQLPGAMPEDWWVISVQTLRGQRLSCRKDALPADRRVTCVSIFLSPGN